MTNFGELQGESRHDGRSDLLGRLLCLALLSVRPRRGRGRVPTAASATVAGSTSPAHAAEYLANDGDSQRLRGELTT